MDDKLSAETIAIVASNLTAALAAAGAHAAQACEPVSDMRGSADYKRHLAGELTIRTLRTSVERVRNS